MAKLSVKLGSLFASDAGDASDASEPKGNCST